MTEFVKLSDPRTWLDGRSPRPWRVEFDGHRIEVARQAQGWFGGLRSIGYRIYVDQKLVAYRRA